MTAGLIVDWENVYLELQQLGYSVDPVVALRSLVAAVEDCERIGPSVDRVELHLPETVFDRADKVRIEQAFPTPVAFEHCPAEKNMADVAIALALVQAHYEWGVDGLGAVSQDNDVAYVVKQLGKRRRGRPTAVFRLNGKVPRVLTREPGWAQALAVEPCARRQPRAWTDWDVAAWRLLRLGGRYRPKVGAVVFRQPAEPPSFDDLCTAEPRVVTGRMRAVDDAVADLWKLTWGGPLTLDRALACLRPRHPDAQADALLDALVCAGLVRHDDDGLSVASSWREGLFVPLARLVLHLLVAGGTATGRRLEQSHRLAFIQRHHALDAERKVGSAAAHDSWQRTRDLARKLGIAEPAQGHWHLRRAPFVDEVAQVATDIVTAVGDDRLRFDALRERCCNAGAERGDRWAYVLRAVGLLQVQQGWWSRGGTRLN